MSQWAATSCAVAHAVGAVKSHWGDLLVVPGARASARPGPRHRRRAGPAGGVQRKCGKIGQNDKL